MHAFSRIVCGLLVAGCAAAASLQVSAALPAPSAPRKPACPTAVERTLKVIKDGVTHKGEIVGDRLMIFAADGRSAPAPDGTYLMPNGEKIVVKDGKVQKAASAKAG